MADRSFPVGLFKACCCLDLAAAAVHLAHGYYVQHPDKSWNHHLNFAEGVSSQRGSEN